MSSRTSHLLRTAPVIALAVVTVSGCSMLSLIPGVPHVTTEGTATVVYDGKPVKANVTKLICMYDGKGNVGFVAGEESTGDTFLGAYSIEGKHANVLKTAEFPATLIANNLEGNTDISKATVNGQVYTFEGVMLDLGASASAGTEVPKKPYKAVVTCK